MAYSISGVDSFWFRHLSGFGNDELRAHGALHRTVRAGDTNPERAELRDALAGSTVLLVDHTHPPANNPCRSSHAIFVREHAEEAASNR